MSRAFETRQLVVGDVRSPVLIGGLASTGSADEAVVFVHGNPDVGRDWEPLMSRVSPFARVIAPDMPGFGGAERRANQDYTVAGYAAHLGGLLDQLGVNRAHLVAHDFGGPFSLAWAAGHPDRVASLTLINTGVFIDYRWHRMARLWQTPVVGEIVIGATTPGLARRVLRHDNPGLPDKWVDQIAAHATPRGTKRAILRLYRSAVPPKLLEDVIGPLRQRDPDTLVVWGDRDVYLPVALAERQRRVFPRARIETLPGVGHWAWLEQPERVAELVVPFLREQVGRPTRA